MQLSQRKLQFEEDQFHASLCSTVNLLEKFNTTATWSLPLNPRKTAEAIYWWNTKMLECGKQAFFPVWNLATNNQIIHQLISQLWVKHKAMFLLYVTNILFKLASSITKTIKSDFSWVQLERGYSQQNVPPPVFLSCDSACLVTWHETGLIGKNY